MHRTRSTLLGFSRLFQGSSGVVRTPHIVQYSSNMGDLKATPAQLKDDDITRTFQRVFDLFEKKHLLQTDKSTDSKVIDFKHPAELQKILPLQIQQQGCGSDEILAACEQVIDYSVKTGHKHFVNQLYHRPDPYGVMGSWMTDLLNTNEHTFEAAPVFILVTKYLLQEFQALLGYNEADIMFFPGGSMANFCSIHLARHRYLEGDKDAGLWGLKRMTLFASEECHYSIKKAAMFMGFGLDSVRIVKTDDRGRMCPKDLEEKVKASKEQGENPIYVMATCGTTVLGAFDPLNPIADVCDKYKLWLHVDGCWGGAALFSKTQRKLMTGIERTNSFNVSLHKMMGAPIQCVPFIVKDKDILADAYSFDVPYLFQTDKFYDQSFDMGTKTVQCGRRPDALKFWLMWKARGYEGFEAMVDNSVRLARIFEEKMRARPTCFRPVLEGFDFVNISYWYIPPSLQGQTEDDAWWQKIHKVSPKIKERMTLNGNLMVGYQPQPEKNRVNFFRIIIQNPELTEADLDFFLDETERLGKDL